MSDERWQKALESIAGTMTKIEEPLTSNQRVVLAGALAVWIEPSIPVSRLRELADIWEELARICRRPASDALLDCRDQLRRLIEEAEE